MLPLAAPRQTDIVKKIAPAAGLASGGAWRRAGTPMFSALLCVAGGSKTELNKNILAGLCATLSPNVYDREIHPCPARPPSFSGLSPPEAGAENIGVPARRRRRRRSDPP